MLVEGFSKHGKVLSLWDTYIDRIVARGHYTERAAAGILKTVVEVVQGPLETTSLPSQVTCGASFTEFFKAFVWVLYHDGVILYCNSVVLMILKNNETWSHESCMFLGQMGNSGKAANIVMVGEHGKRGQSSQPMGDTKLFRSEDNIPLLT
ncbi:hypothetical protein MTR67_022257 [Solanum verrucosum]|uniref:Uncharacterized protein n=1 Tax=Solanum verrucosum TaxID=315347 RepID=A0AAF0QRJ5_SOLVR|nr:hypothetical protein MTR67_022257 [Solanum verrucosum]